MVLTWMELESGGTDIGGGAIEMEGGPIDMGGGFLLFCKANSCSNSSIAFKKGKKTILVS